MRSAWLCLLSSGCLFAPDYCSSWDGSITVNVVDAAGDEVSDVSATARTADGGIEDECEVISSFEIYCMEDASPGAYTVSVSAPGFVTQEVAAMVPQRDRWCAGVTFVDVVLEREP